MEGELKTVLMFPSLTRRLKGIGVHPETINTWGVWYRGYGGRRI